MTVYNQSKTIVWLIFVEHSVAKPVSSELNSHNAAKKKFLLFLLLSFFWHISFMVLGILEKILFSIISYQWFITRTNLKSCVNTFKYIKF